MPYDGSRNNHWLLLEITVFAANFHLLFQPTVLLFNSMSVGFSSKPNICALIFLGHYVQLNCFLHLTSRLASKMFVDSCFVSTVNGCFCSCLVIWMQMKGSFYDLYICAKSSFKFVRLCSWKITIFVLTITV